MTKTCSLVLVDNGSMVVCVCVICLEMYLYVNCAQPLRQTQTLLLLISLLHKTSFGLLIFCFSIMDENCHCRNRHMPLIQGRVAEAAA